MDLEKYYKDTENKGIDEFWALSDDKKKEILSEKEEFERLEPYYLLFEALTQYIRVRKHYNNIKRHYDNIMEKLSQIKNENNQKSSDSIFKEKSLDKEHDAKAYEKKRNQFLKELELTEVNICQKREILYQQLLTNHDIACGKLLMLIIFAYVYNDTPDIFKNKKSTGSFDAKKFKYFFDSYSQKKRVPKKYQDSFNDIDKVLICKVAIPIKADYRTIKRFFTNNAISIQRAVAICLCLDLDTFISVEFLKRAGYDLSPYSPVKINRVLYSLLEDRPFVHPKDGEFNDMILWYNIVLESVGLKNLTLTGRQKSDK
jgi:hypothetical protein